MAKKNVIWFESLTPKQTMLFLAIGKILKSYGFEILYTTREHDYIQDIFSTNNIQPKSMGEYGGSTLKGKLIASASRMLELSEYIADYKENIIGAVSFSSPDASRVAFGLGIPLILLNDTSHSTSVGRLTFSLARYLITPISINKKSFVEMGANPKIIHQYKGVDEVEYISGENYEKFLEFREKAKDKNKFYLVFRPEESFASYMKDKESKPYLEILQHIIENYEGEIIVFPRYPQQKESILEKFEGQIKIPTNGFYFLNLLSNAEVVITGGGTMGREAALLGIPSITYFWRHLEPQIYIENRGFPSYSIRTIEDTKKFIEKICSNPENYFVDTATQLRKMEKPSDILIPLLKKDKDISQYF
ncbi:MAG TPA: DUF354 domain-containing protein [candidate division Zixibacteria bacterium]|nr:DUF354 domain-containing protein [candidate division Zixibacteria bacterium]